MIPYRIEFCPTRTQALVARLAALGVLLGVFESLLPLPLGMKLGLANISTLVAAHLLGMRAAVAVSVLRIVAGSLFLGSFLSLGFFLSLLGGMSALLGLWFANGLPKAWFGLVSASLFAAFGHLVGQIMAVCAFGFPWESVRYVLPILLGVACISGVLNAVFADYFLTLRMDEYHEKD